MHFNPEDVVKYHLLGFSCFCVVVLGGKEEIPGAPSFSSPTPRSIAIAEVE